MYVPRAFSQRAELDEAINEIKPALGPDFVRMIYTLERDWSGDHAIFFKVVIADRASSEDRLRSVTSHIRDTIRQGLEPLEQWGAPL